MATLQIGVAENQLARVCIVQSKDFLPHEEAEEVPYLK